MEPKISNLSETKNLKFTLSNANVCYANAIRRTILTDIPCVVFKTSPYNENKVNIIDNTTRMNNEVIKQRLSCIPIYINIIDQEFDIDDYLIELNVSNRTNTIIYATSKDFKIKNLKNQKYLTEAALREIFPPDKITGDYIDIVRLRPSIIDINMGECINLTAKLTIQKAKDDGAYNVISTCSYGNTLDNILIKENWEKKLAILKDKHTKQEIDFLKRDYDILEKKRYFINDSFDFTIETISVYNNFKLLELACAILIKELYFINKTLQENYDLIYTSDDTMENSYTIKLINQDYTLGKIIEYNLYKKYFNEQKILTFVGFLKKHPHDEYSIIKIAFKNVITVDDIIVIINECINDAILQLNIIKKYFAEK